MNSTQQHEIQTFIVNYAAAVNSGSSELISDYYASSGVFMPDGFPTLSNGEQFEKNILSYFGKKSILIAYEIADIAIEGNIALVNAIAVTRNTDLKSKKETTKKTRDLFVLQFKGNECKILRYLFNNY